MATPNRQAPHSEAASPRHAVVVAGMHRSGTSALAGVLHRLGARLPLTPLAANENNPRGYYESAVVCDFHDALFEAAGSGWSHLEPLHPEAWQSPALVDDLCALIEREFDLSSVFLVKDPRICRVLPLWQRAFEQLDVRARYVIPVREPEAVARSLEQASGVPLGTGRLLWLDSLLEVERATRGATRAFVAHEALRNDWRGVLPQILERAEIPLPRPNREIEAAIDAFLVPRDESGRPGRPPHPWIDRLHVELRHACEGKAPNAAMLDELRSAYREAEAAFGPALADARVALQTTRDRLSDRRDEVARLEQQREQARQRRHALQSRLERQQEETEGLRRTIEMLMRERVDRTRSPGERAPQALRSAFEALQKAAPADIPGIASTGALLSALHEHIEALEAERERRAQEIARLARDTAAAEASAHDARAERDALRTDADALARERAEAAARLEAIGRETRILRAKLQAADAEVERLSSEVARLLDERETRRGSWFRSRNPR